MRQKIWLKLVKYYSRVINYYPRKVNMVADTLIINLINFINNLKMQKFEYKIILKSLIVNQQHYHNPTLLEKIKELKVDEPYLNQLKFEIELEKKKFHIDEGIIRF